ncbi:MAG: S-(hydroxymethyl)glutathione dehydrogenase / alcohol dehydrogenase [Thermomicrobiales bacterium]|nr:S-(hydroxymethyl)glutathione dehydrogenase / alcohol dehydrogenase [Thermomicrobiales bacterium]
MRAAVLNQIPGPLEIAEVQIDDPGPREVLVRVVASGLCHSDLHFMEGKYDHQTPVVLGHEAAGVVEAVGREVADLQPGDHVVACLSVFCGHCPDCLSGRPALCVAPERERAPEQPPRLSKDGERIHQFAHLSAFAEQMLVHEHALVKIRPDMPLDRAALIGCAVTTGVGAVINTAKVPPGSTVAVLGCGGIGLNCIQGAALAGAGRIIAVDTLAWKLGLARDFGATDLVDAAEEDPVATVRELTGGGVEYSFEAIGLKLTAEQSFAMLCAGGTATLIGLIPEGQKIELLGTDFLSEKRVQGSSMGSNRFRIDIPRYVDFYLAGKLKLDEMISARISLDDVNAGYDALKRGEVARSVIVFD